MLPHPHFTENKNVEVQGCAQESLTGKWQVGVSLVQILYLLLMPPLSMYFIYTQLKPLRLQGHLLVPAHRNLVKPNFLLFITLLIAHSLIPTPLGHPISRLKRRHDIVNESLCVHPFLRLVQVLFRRKQDRKPQRVIILLL